MSIKILGIAQDGGVPHFDCKCENCSNLRHMVSSIAIISDEVMLVDATPDITPQVRMLDKPIDAILITHLHIGHYLGLLQLGREVASTNNFPVYVTKQVGDFLQSNKPFSYLLDRGEIKLIRITPEVPFIFGKLEMTAFEVPHRNEDGNTIGLEIKGERRVIYLPDIDFLPTDLINRIKTADLVFLDATFYSKTEIDRQRNVPHPSILEIMGIFGRPKNEFNLTHLNHSNPVLDINSQEYRQVIEQGYKIPIENSIYFLGKMIVDQ
jgi:pyrroloquinoline quinone biosynthesis protein B